MKNTINLLLITLFFLSSSCHNRENKKNVKEIKIEKSSNSIDSTRSISSSFSDYDSLSKQSLNGNRDAYDEIFYIFMDSNKESRTDSLMIYSKILAEKYDYKRAYFDYFKAFCEKLDINVDFSNYASIDISSMDKSSKKQAKEWLKKMLEKKVISQDQYNSVKQ